jgi:heptosyltransferase-1
MDYKNILIIKMSAIGDIIHALPAAKALKTAFPEARLTWIVEKLGYDLLSHNPYLDEIIIFDKPKFKSWRGFLANAPSFTAFLREKKFDLTLDLQGLLKSSAIAVLSGSSKRLVYEGAKEGSYLFSKRVVGDYAKGHVTDRYLDVIRALGCEADGAAASVFLAPAEIEQAKNILAAHALDNNIPYVILALGANWTNKIWPPAYFAELSGLLYAQGLVPVVIGAAADLPRFAALSALAAKPPVNLIGQTSLKELTYIIEQARAFVGSDTGPMHLAATTNTPVIALMGSTDPVRSAPYPTRGKKRRVLVTNRLCAGCGAGKCAKGLDCLAAISVAEVFGAIVEVVEN